MTLQKFRMTFAALTCGVLFLSPASRAATLTLTTNVIGATPERLAYNSGHFFTNSNTRDWWRYAGVTGARVFVSPSDIEASDDLAPVGDGVTDSASFIARREALRANPLNTNYIYWPYFSNRYETVDLGANGGNNHIRVNYCFRELRRLGIRICAQITASSSRLPITGDTDWAGKWELWQHFYAQASYLARVFDVDHYQMYNEPDLAGLVDADFLRRLQLASDAIQSAIADVNSLYGKSLVPCVLAPVNAGTADSDIALLGGVAVTNRHVDYLGGVKPDWLNFHKYDYHQYSGGASGFGTDLVNLNKYLTSAMSPEPPFPTTCSEFNTHTGATFDGLTQTLDTPAEYASFGGICVALMSNLCSELYAFKFSQTERTGGTYPVAKNAMHYVDNTNSPYNIGGITRAGEVYRLFNKAFAPGRDRLGSVKGSGAGNFEIHASYDPVRRRYYLFSVNGTASNVAIEFAFTTLPLPVGNRVLLEEVSETTYGSGVLWTSVAAGRTVSAGTQSSNSVWLLTLPAEPQAPEQILTASADAEVRDGSNQTVNYGSAANMTARNDPANTANRSAAFLKFDLAGIVATNIEFALLSLQASTISTNATVQAHIYALDTNNWSPNTITWSNAPNLRQNVTTGNTIAKQCVVGAGDTAHIVGQVVVTSTNAGEKLIDVTDWLRGRTNTAITFLVCQDPRWDVQLPSLATGDAQPDGVRIITTEGGNGPRLRIVLKPALPANTPPAATNDAYRATEDTPLVVSAPGVLGNDFDAETNALKAVLVSPPLHGNLLLNTNGSFTYTPDTNYNGIDSFTYKANDGQADSGVALVSIAVASVNDAPIAWNDSATTSQNFPIVIHVLANDSDVDGGTLAIVSFTQGASGSVSNNGNGTLTYSPNLNFTGSDSFSYAITDGQGGTNSASVSLITTAAVDTVGDGIPDWWRALYFGGNGTTTNSSSCATCDPDRDRAANYHEYLADTNPTNQFLYFHLQAISITTNLAVFFQSSANRKYTLYYANDSIPGVWSNVPSQTDIPGSGGVDVLRDSLPTGESRFYRVGVRLP